MYRKLQVSLALILVCVHTMGQDALTTDSVPPGALYAHPPAWRDKLTAEDYQKLTTSGHIVLVDFYASWCGPCKLMEPMLNELSEEQKGRVEVIRINVDENKELMQSMAIWEIPAIKIYKDGKEHWSRVGYTEKRVISRQLRRI